VQRRTPIVSTIYPTVQQKDTAIDKLSDGAGVNSDNGLQQISPIMWWISPFVA
jgi:hypothetical protein